MIGVGRMRVRPPAPQIDVAPMIDMMFILLVFFLVTASFVRDEGIAVNRTAAATARPVSGVHLRIALTASALIFAEGRQLDLSEVRGEVAGFRNRAPDGTIVLIPDTACPSGRLVEVMDACRAAGCEDFVVATRPAR